MKKGFTLAEVLITLAVIGVIAAITIPTLNKDTTSAQIGPKLAKAVSAFEQANKALLNNLQVDRLSETGLIAASDSDQEKYPNNLSSFFKFSKINYNGITGKTFEGFGPPSSQGASYISKDGMVYIIYSTSGLLDSTKLPHKDIAGFVWIDINGTTKPNIIATDVFVFQLMNDGSLQPVGGTFLNKNANVPHWLDKCPLAEKGSVDEYEYEYCAGHIFENNLKVLYR